MNIHKIRNRKTKIFWSDPYFVNTWTSKEEAQKVFEKWIIPVDRSKYEYVELVLIERDIYEEMKKEQEQYYKLLETLDSLPIDVKELLK